MFSALRTSASNTLICVGKWSDCLSTQRIAVTDCKIAHNLELEVLMKLGVGKKGYALVPHRISVSCEHVQGQHVSKHSRERERERERAREREREKERERAREREKAHPSITSNTFHEQFAF